MSTSPPVAPIRTKWLNLGLLSLASLLALTLWFSGSAALPQLTREWALDAGQRSWMTMSVQIGFVVGALVSAILNLPDRLPLRALFAVSAVLGAIFNALILVSPGPSVALPLRFLTGVTLAGVYPPGMKLVATWCKADRGLGIGLLVGAVTFGSAVPHVLNAFPIAGEAGMPPWRLVLGSSSIMALLAAVIGAFGVRPGPHLLASAPFDWRFIGRALGHRPTRLANFGYLGHMWELYSMWTWVPILLLASYQAAGWNPMGARVAGFGTVAIGAVGSVLAGVLADRWGRTVVATASLVVSGACCLVAGLFFGTPAVLTVVCLVWGFAVVADSAQFSAAVSELTDPRYVGTALTVQTSMGFLLTMITIRVVPPLVEALGWGWVFVVLVPGPVFGVWSMLRLRGLPEARRMASGAR